MGFFSGIANFGSKILGGVKKAAQWVAPALHKVLSTISGPVGMIHPAIGGALSAGANLSGAMDRLKRGNSSGGMMSNEEYQLFIDNNNALVYAANNQIVDGMASDFALKIEPNDVQNLPNSANGDFAFSAESGTVWMYDQNWYNSGDIVLDQVTPASDATPLSDGRANAGNSTEYSRVDHVHPLNITSTIPTQDTASGSVDTANYYARNDHSHPINITTTTPPQDSADGQVGTTNYYARNDHSHPINVETNASNIPIVNGVGAIGTSAFYARQDNVHSQQLTYDGNVTATKFIKAGGLATEILCAKVDTTTIDSKISRTYNGSAGGWIRLCVFPAGASVGSPFIEFKVYSSYNAVRTIRLVLYYTVNGINTVYGIFTAAVKVSSYYDIEQGVNQLFHNHSGSGTSAIYSAYVRLESAGTVTIVVSDQCTYYTNRITEILTQDVVQGVANGTQIPITYDLANGGIINNMLQVNPIGRTYATYNNGIRIGNYYTQYSSLYLGWSTTAIKTTQTGQWEISKTSDRALTINLSSLRQTDHSVGLSINGDCTQLKFNGNELVNVGTDQTITGKKTFAGVKCDAIQINPTVNNFNEGIRISRSTISDYSGIYLGCDPNQATGTITDQWSIVTTNAGSLRIGVGDQLLYENQGLMISADGNTLTFNGSVIAGTGATNGATNGSVNYSAGNPILWGVNSTDPIGGFYSNGNNVFWRAHPLTLGSVPP
ncbi:MAG: hypothetical protein EZS28_005707 [Streblomastix strix]|uniref:Uncharacterized protein n=1 Tax=Streblomastix strix TaxID=222440 RepID=A0A5J4WUQ0_9EUKA|nr:MAG: hypothetical protein EZS28_005707 [Streblomastix strix]